MNNLHSYNQQQLNKNQLLQENINLKKKLHSLQQNEKIYQSSIAKLKKFQIEYQNTFNKALKDYKQHEEQIKKTYINYQKLIENHYKENENRFLEENTKLTMELKQKNNIIKNLNNKIRLLNQKLNKVEYDFQYENKKLESEVVSKERRLSELNESMIQLARNTNDEIKLLRDEFEFFNKRNKKIKRYQSFQKTEDHESKSLKLDDLDINNVKTKRYYYEKEKNNNKNIDYLINKINLLENQNRNLTKKLKRKEEELFICNKLKNELFYKDNLYNEKESLFENKRNNLKNYFPSNLKENNSLSNLGNKLKFNKSSNNFRDYINKNEYNDKKFNKYSYKTHHEIPKTNIDLNNDIKKNYNIYKEKRKNINDDIFNGHKNYNKFLNDYDINELVITSNLNNFHNLNEYDGYDMINQEEGIKDEYINSKLPKINTLD